MKNIMHGIKAKLVAGALACLTLGAAAATVTVEIPAEGGTASTATVSNPDGRWYFDGSNRPDWVSGVVLRNGGSSISVGRGTLTYGILTQAYFNVTASKNTGSARSWTWNILSAKGGSTVATLVVKQAGQSSSSSATPSPSTPQTSSFAVTASKGTYTSYVSVTWKAGKGAKSYCIYRSTMNDFDGATELGTTTKLSWTDKTVSRGTKYWYFVRAVDAYGDELAGGGSDSGYAKAVAVPKPKATDGSYAGYVKITWTKASDISKYYVFRSTTTSFDDASCIGYSTTGAASDKTATLGVKYYYWICPVVGSDVYAKKSAYDAGYRKVTLTITTPKTVKLGKTGNLVLKVNGKVVKGGFSLSYSSAYLQLLQGTGNAFCRIRGVKAGTATLKLRYGTTAAVTATWKVKVVK